MAFCLLFYMSLFISTYKNKVDKKLRVSVPAQFRSAISDSAFQGIIAYRSIINDCIEGCSLERLENLTALIDNLDPFSSEKDAFATSVLGGSYQLQFDPEGRVLLPQDLVCDLQIEETAVFIGKGHTFEIWNEAKFEEHIVKSRQIAFENRDKLRNNR